MSDVQSRSRDEAKRKRRTATAPLTRFCREYETSVSQAAILDRDRFSRLEKLTVSSPRPPLVGGGHMNEKGICQPAMATQRRTIFIPRYGVPPKKEPKPGTTNTTMNTTNVRQRLTKTSTVNRYPRYAQHQYNTTSPLPRPEEPNERH